MLSLRCIAVLAGVVLLGACATAPASRPGAIDSTGTIWGDEYEGLAVDGGETVRALPRGFNVEHVDGATQSTRVDAFAHGASIHARSFPSGDVGSVSWQSETVLREIVAGDFTPVIAEGALMGDPRTGGDLRPSSTAHISSLAMRPSTSAWSSVRGGGLTLAANTFRMSLGGWETHDGGRVGVTSIERISRGGLVGVAAGVSDDDRQAASLYASRDAEKMFASAELALSQGRVRGVARVVSDDFSAVAIAGAGPANDAPLVFARKERWGAALERHDGWSWGASRVGVSSLTRRDVVSDIRRRRAFWDAEWRVSSDTRFQLAARFTRETGTRPVKGALASLPSQDVAEDWRVRATLRVFLGLTDNSYRLEWVQNRTGKPGMIASWSWRLRTGPLDTRLAASAHALGSGQVSYSTDDAPPGLVEYSPVTGRGASLAASCRLWLRHHAWLGAAWSQAPPRPQRVWITVGLRG